MRPAFFAGGGTAAMTFDRRVALANPRRIAPRSALVMSPASTRQFWETRATALAWRINFAAWLASAAPVFFFVATGSAVAIYALRRAQSAPASAWLGFAAAFALAALGCWWRARRGFYNSAEARVLLESHLRLDTRLTAATSGLVAWPAAPASLAPVVRWQLRAPGGWIAASAALLALAGFAPVPRDAAATHASGPAPAILQTESMLAALKEMKLADPQAIEQLADRARELARRPADEQYSHSALEAADALRNQTAVAAAGLARGLDAAADALRSTDSADMKGSAGRLAAALAGLRDGSLPANKDLLANLPTTEAELAALTPEQRADLARALASAAGAARGVSGAAGAGAQVAQGDPDGAGAGGDGGDGDSAPLMLAKDASDAGDGTTQGLTLGSLKHFSLGDKLGTTMSTHDVDPKKAAGSTSAGAVAAPAQGGDAVWVERLTPAERAALKKFFK